VQIDMPATQQQQAVQPHGKHFKLASMSKHDKQFKLKNSKLNN